MAATSASLRSRRWPPVGPSATSRRRRPANKNRDAHVPLSSDSPAVAEWRTRMGTEAAQAIYRLRAATAEWVNALARNRGLQQFRVRGLAKVRAVLSWFALAHNLVQSRSLRPGAVE